MGQGTVAWWAGVASEEVTPATRIERLVSAGAILADCEADEMETPFPAHTPNAGWIVGAAASEPPILVIIEA